MDFQFFKFKKIWIIGIFLFAVLGGWVYQRGWKSDLFRNVDSEVVSPNPIALATSSSSASATEEPSSAKSASYSSKKTAPKRPNKGNSDSLLKSTTVVSKTFTSSAEARKENLIKRLIQRDPKASSWNVEQNEGGLVKTVYGGVLPELANSPTELNEFVQSISEDLGVPKNQLSSGPVLFQNSISIVYDFKQTYEGYEVEDGFLRVQATSDGGVYYLASELKKIDKPTIDLDKTSDRSVLIGLIQKKYPHRDFHIEGETPPLRIYVKPDGSSELSWICMVRFPKSPMDRRKMIIGTKSLKIHLDESQLRNFQPLR